ncbi:E-selectin-like [Ylistrum balloti]|uniref:E-selectin-like n=1 Tax=Ylistrum balloti TaxID=509963 RepID=UPI002905848E|nr:E-selectin-like [Ylistrum balloti]
MVTVGGVKWREELSSVDLACSPSLLTTTVTTLIVCLATCVKTTSSKTAIYNTRTRTCDCYDSLTTMTSLMGNRLWSLQIDGYIHNHSLGLYMKIVADQWLSHDSANNVCAADGGRLVVMETVDKHNYITSLSDVKYNSYYHIGANDKVAEDTFVWETGSAVSRQSTLWAPSQPDNHHNNQNCLVLYQWVYDDASCHNQMNFICELV